MSGKRVGTMFVGKRKGVEVDCVEYACNIVGSGSRRSGWI